MFPSLQPVQLSCHWHQRLRWPASRRSVACRGALLPLGIPLWPRRNSAWAPKQFLHGKTQGTHEIIINHMYSYVIQMANKHRILDQGCIGSGSQVPIGSHVFLNAENVSTSVASGEPNRRWKRAIAAAACENAANQFLTEKGCVPASSMMFLLVKVRIPFFCLERLHLCASSAWTGLQLASHRWSWILSPIRHFALDESWCHELLGTTFARRKQMLAKQEFPDISSSKFRSKVPVSLMPPVRTYAAFTMRTLPTSLMMQCIKWIMMLSENFKARVQVPLFYCFYFWATESSKTRA